MLVVALFVATFAVGAAFWLGTQPAAAQTTQSALSALSLSDITLSPAFEAGTTDYVGMAAAGTTQTTVSATPESGTTATISPADADDLTDGHQVDVVHGTEIDITTSATNQLDTTYSVVVSFGAASVQSVAVTSDAGTDATYATNDVITLSATFDRPVSVDIADGTPHLTIRSGSHNRVARFSSIDATNKILTFSYTVVADDGDQSGISIRPNVLSLNGGSIKDMATDEDAVLDHAPLDDQPAHRVNKFPTIPSGGIAITSTPLATSDTYGAGETISFTITFDSVVVVDISGGTPALRMRFWHSGIIGARDKDLTYVGGSGTDTLTFEYVVQPADIDRSGLAVRANQLRFHGGTIRHYTTNRNADLSHSAPSLGDSEHKVDGSLSPPRATLSTLSLSDTTLSPTFEAETARYLGITTVGTIHTTVTATAESGTTVTILPSDSKDGIDGHQVDIIQGAEIAVTASADGTLPTTYTVAIHFAASVQSIAVTSDAGADATYADDDTITLAVTFNNPVSVDTAEGTPHLTIRSGSKNRNAGYTSIDATNRVLSFAYTVVSADGDQSGIAIRANSLSLNGGSIKDMATDEDAVLDHDALENQPSHRVNKYPTIPSGSIAITSTPLATSDTYGAGETISFTITFDSVVVVDISGGTPALRMRFWHSGIIGARDKDLTYVGGSGTDTLTFEYVVQSADRDRSGLAVRANQLRLHGGTIRHYTTNRNADLRHSVPSLGDSGHKVDGSLNPPRATLSTLSLSDATLSPIFEAETTTYIGAATAGTTRTTVSATADSGTAITISPADADGGTDGHQVDITQGTEITITTSADGTISTTYAVTVQFTTAVQSVAITSDAGTDATYAEDDTIAVAVTFNYPVSVDTADGTPSLIINLGGSDRSAGYSAIDATNRILTFSYTVKASDSDQDGISIDANSLSLNGATITDSAINTEAVLVHDAIADRAGHRVNKIPRIVTGGVAITSTPLATSDTYGFAETISFTVTFDSKVVVDTTNGVPTLAMKFSEGGGIPVTRNLSYTNGTGTASLVFEYVVQIGDVDDNGLAVAANQLVLNSATIKHSTTGRDANLNHAIPGTDGVFSDHKVDGDLNAPRATLSTLSLTDITLSPAFEAGITNYVGTAIPGTTRTTVAAAADSGISVRVSPDDGDGGLNGHQVNVGHGTEITVTTFAMNHLTTRYKVTVYFNAEALSAAFSSDPGADATYATGDVVSLDVKFDKPVSVNTGGGTPDVTIKVGDNDRNAAYSAIDSTGRILTFSYTLVAGDSDQDGISVDADYIALNGGSITDAGSGQPAILSHDPVSDHAGHLVNKIPNIVTNGVRITSTPLASADAYGVGEIIAFSVTFDSNVVVDTAQGTPSLRMNFQPSQGVPLLPKELVYARGSGTSTLVFQYEVQSGDLDYNGLTMEANQLRLNGGTITHATTTQDAVLTHAGPGDAGRFPGHKVNGGLQGAMLTALSLGDGTLSPTFNPGIANYTAVVGRAVPRTTVAASADTGTTVSISPEDSDTDTPGHQVDLARGANTITVTVSKSGLITRTYTVTLTRTWAEIRKVAITSDPGWDNTYAPGDEIEVSIIFNQPVSVDTTNGRPYVVLTSGVRHRNATFASVDPTSRILTFTYTLGPVDHSESGAALREDSLVRNGATIKHAYTNENALITHPVLRPDPRHRINKQPEIIPGGIKIASNPVAGEGTYGEGEIIRFRVTFDSLVVVDTENGVPFLTVRFIERGHLGRDVPFRYTAGSGSQNLYFERVVQPGDADNDGISVRSNPLSLNGGAIRHMTTHRDARLTHGGVDTDAGHKVDSTIVPTLLFLCGLRVPDKNAEVDLCWQMLTPIPTDEDVIFEMRWKPFYGVPIDETDTEDFREWLEFARGNNYTSCPSMCVRTTHVTSSGRGGGLTYQLRMRRGDTILGISSRLEVHAPNRNDAELDVELSGVFHPHDFTSYPGDVATGPFRTDLTFTDPVVRATVVELVRGLQLSDFNISNGAVTNIVPDPGASYVITVVPTVLGKPVTITLPQGTVSGVGAAIHQDGRNDFTRRNNASNTLTVKTAEP